MIDHHRIETRVWKDSQLIGKTVEELRDMFNIEVQTPSDYTTTISEGDYITFTADAATIIEVLKLCIPKKEDVIVDKIQKEWERFAEEELGAKEFPLELYAKDISGYDPTDDVKLTKQGNEFLLIFKETNVRFTLIPKVIKEE